MPGMLASDGEAPAPRRPAGPAALPEADEVHLWLVSLDGSPDELARLGAAVSADEHVRAGRFRFHHDRDRFIAARGHLRAVLASYLRCSPAQLAFAYGARGKPVLAGGNPHALAFSLAHVRSYALIGVARGRRLGVDLEATALARLGDAEAALFLSDTERRRLAAFAADGRARALLLAWVQKEAYAKARGDGLALDLRSIEVEIGPDAGGLLPRLRDDPVDAEEWWVRTVDLGPELVAAVAVEGGAARLVRCAGAQAAR